MKILGNTIAGTKIVEISDETYDSFRKIAMALSTDVCPPAWGRNPGNPEFWHPFRGFIFHLASVMSSGVNETLSRFNFSMTRETTFRFGASEIGPIVVHGTPEPVVEDSDA